MDTTTALIIGGDCSVQSAGQILSLLGVQKVFIACLSPSVGTSSDPRVHLISGPIEEHLDKVDVVLVVNLTMVLITYWNKVCRTHRKDFVAIRSMGLLGFIFVDPYVHESAPLFDGYPLLSQERLYFQCFSGYDQFVTLNKREPKPRNTRDRNAFVQQIQAYYGLIEGSKNLLIKFCDTCTGELIPLVKTFWVMAAVEISKLLKNSKPVGFKWLSHLDSHYIEGLTELECTEPSGPFSSQIKIIGKKNQKLLEASDVVVVGLSGVGTCLIKDLISLGFGKEGTISIFDDQSKGINLKDLASTNHPLYKPGIGLHPIKLEPNTEQRHLPYLKKAKAMICLNSENSSNSLEELAYRMTVQNNSPLLLLAGTVNSEMGLSRASIPFQSATFLDDATPFVLTDTEPQQPREPNPISLLVSCAVSLNLIYGVLGRYDALCVSKIQLEDEKNDYILQTPIPTREPLFMLKEYAIYPYERFAFSIEQDGAHLIEALQQRYSMEVEELIAFPDTDQPTRMVKRRETLPEWLAGSPIYRVASPSEVMLALIAASGSVRFRILLSLKKPIALDVPLPWGYNELSFFNTALQALLLCRTWMEQIKHSIRIKSEASQPVIFGLRQYLIGSFSNEEFYNHLCRYLPQSFHLIPQPRFKDPVYVIDMLESTILKELNPLQEVECRECHLVRNFATFQFSRPISKHTASSINPQSILTSYPLQECSRCKKQTVELEHSMRGENHYVIMTVRNSHPKEGIIPDPLLALLHNSRDAFYELVGAVYKLAPDQHFGYSLFDKGWYRISGANVEPVHIKQIFQEQNTPKLFVYRKCSDQNQQHYKTFLVRPDPTIPITLKMTSRIQTSPSELSHSMKLFLGLPHTSTCPILDSYHQLQNIPPGIILEFEHSRSNESGCANGVII